MSAVHRAFHRWRRAARVSAWAIFLSAAIASVTGQTRPEGDIIVSYGVERFGSVQSSPAISADGNTIFFGVSYASPSADSGQVIAIGRLGAERWVSNMPDFVTATPAIGRNGHVYVGVYDGTLRALDPANGRTLWVRDTAQTDEDAPYIQSGPSIARNGDVYVGVGDFGRRGRGAVVAFSSDGALLWRGNTIGAVEGSPAIGADGTIYVGTLEGVVHAFAPDGTPIWDFDTRTKLSESAGAGSIYGSPAIGRDGTIYVGGLVRYLALSPQGTPKWHRPLTVAGGSAIAPDDTVYVGSLDGHLYAFDPSGAELWRSPVGGEVWSTPTVRADGVIIVGSDDRAVYAFDPTRTRRWRRSVGGMVESSAAISPDGMTLYVGSNDGFLHIIAGNGSPLSAYSPWPWLRQDPQARGQATGPLEGGRLVNLATRAQTGAANNLIAGFVVEGNTTKYYLLRGVGPSLSTFGVAAPLNDPRLTVFRAPLVTPRELNDDWTELPDGPSIVNTTRSVGAFELPAGSKDSVLVSLLEPGVYTAQVTSADGSPGVALVEVYDAAPAATGSRLLNLSTRGHVGPEANALIPGLVVAGDGPVRLLVRAVGPGLGAFGVPGTVPRPTMRVFDSAGAAKAQNTGWIAGGAKADLIAAAARVGAFPLSEASADSAVLITVEPGSYTIQVTPADTRAGEGLVEVYVAP